MAPKRKVARWNRDGKNYVSFNGWTVSPTDQRDQRTTWALHSPTKEMLLTAATSGTAKYIATHRMEMECRLLPGLDFFLIAGLHRLGGAARDDKGLVIRQLLPILEAIPEGARKRVSSKADSRTNINGLIRQLQTLGALTADTGGNTRRTYEVKLNYSNPLVREIVVIIATEQPEPEVKNYEAEVHLVGTGETENQTEPPRQEEGIDYDQLAGALLVRVTELIKNPPTVVVEEPVVKKEDSATITTLRNENSRLTRALTDQESNHTRTVERLNNRIGTLNDDLHSAMLKIERLTDERRDLRQTVAGMKPQQGRTIRERIDPTTRAALDSMVKGTSKSKGT